MDASFKIDGAKDLDVALKLLDSKLRNQITSKALRAGGNLIKVRAKQNLAKNKRTGALSKSLIVKVKKINNTITAFVGFRKATKDQKRSAKNKGKVAPDGWYAHFVEFGTAPHSLARGANLSSRKKARVGKQHPGGKASPFLLPALNSEASAVIKKIAETITVEMLRVIKR